MKRLVLFWTPFNRAKFDESHKNKHEVHPTLTKGWILPRLEFWRKYVLPSIQNQTCSDWRYALCCDPETLQIIDHEMELIHEPRLFVDYHNTAESKRRIREMSENYHEIITIRLDSDDLYSKDAIQCVMDSPNDWCYFGEGYGFEWSSGRMWRYDTLGTGPFFSHRYKDPKVFGEKFEINEPPHNWVKRQKPDRIKGGKFIVSLTGMNTTTSSRCRNFISEIDSEETRNRILENFGVL